MEDQLNFGSPISLKLYIKVYSLGVGRQTSNFLLPLGGGTTARLYSMKVPLVLCTTPSSDCD